MIENVIEAQNPWWAHPEARPREKQLFRREIQVRILRKVQDFQDRRAGVLLGPRQVGKTVVLKQLVADLLDDGWPAGNVLYLDLSDERITEVPSPRSVTAHVPTNHREDVPRVILIDEIGRFEGWDLWLKQAVDEGRNRHVVTDSAAALLSDGGRESGLGRWDEYEIETFSFIEALQLVGRTADDLGPPDPVESYLRIGGFPEHILVGDAALMRERLRADVVERAIMRDLMRTGLKDVEKVRALFVYLVQDSGAMLSAAARAHDLQVDQRSVGTWVQRLMDTRLVRPLSRRGSATYPAAGLRARPRVYATDHALISAFSDLHDPFIDARTVGRIVEAIVFRHLRQLARGVNANLSHFRTDKGDVEVDFVLDAAGPPIAIEVTSAAKVTGKKLKTVQRAGELLKAGARIIVHRGVVRDEREGTLLLPLHEFLRDPRGSLDRASS